MKRTIGILVFMLIALATTVSAIGWNDMSRAATGGKAATFLTQTQTQQMEQTELSVEERERIRERIEMTIEEKTQLMTQTEQQTQTRGLENAMIFCSDEALPVLQANLERIQNNQAEQLRKLEQIRIRQEESSTYFEGQGEGKLLGLFKIRKTFEYRLNGAGDLIRNPKWYDGLVPDA